MSISEMLFFHNVQIYLQCDRKIFGQDFAKLFQSTRPVSGKSLNDEIETSISIKILGERTIAVPADSRLLSPENSAFGIYRARNVFYFTFNESILLIDLPRGRAIGYFDDLSLNHPRLVSHRFLFSAILMLLHNKGFYFLHAAALVYENVGYLMVAKSRSGKSTNTIQLIENGWRYLSDEAVLLRYLDNGLVQALAVPNEFKISENLLVRPNDTLRQQSFSVPGIGDDSLLQNTKKYIKMNVVYPEQFIQAGVPQIVIHPIIVESRQSRLQPLNKLETLNVLMEESPLLLTLQSQTGKHLHLLKTLVNQCRNYRLFAGSDIMENPGRLHDLLINISNRELAA